MGATTRIAWCDATFNPWVGCLRVSTACDRCYAAALSWRYGWRDGKGRDLLERKSKHVANSALGSNDAWCARIALRPAPQSQDLACAGGGCQLRTAGGRTA